MLPLSDIRVIEFCQIAAGPFCGMLLGDMGADVIKVEPPAGDALRQWPPFTDGFSESFVSLNRNKRSVVLDLKDETDRSAAFELVLSAQVVVENNRPGVMKRLGLGYEAFKEARPDLVYCSVSAFGQSGPRSGEGGFDLTIQAASGCMSVTGEVDGPPVKCGVPVADFSAGLYAAFAIAAMLGRVAAGGKGGYIDVSMLGASLGISAMQISEYFGNGVDPRRLGSAHPRNAPYRAFRAKDGYFALAAGNDRLWRAVGESLGRHELLDDPRFSTTTERARNQESLKEVLEAQFRERHVQELLDLFASRGIPCAPINRYSDALSDPQVRHMGWVQPVTLPSGAVTRTLASPIGIGGTAAGIRRMPPALGADTEDILASLAGRTAS